MPRFLHIADIHLGFDHYDSRERTQDFFLALQDVLLKHAVEAKVDFVVIAGDLFEHRTIQPAILNQAKAALLPLQAANIPAIAIEGNHDNRPYGTATSWLKYLCDDGLLILLEPTPTDAGVFYEEWDGQAGGYIDLDCGVRVLGSSWYGASAPKAIAGLAAGIERLPVPVGPTVMLFHHGLEGQIARYQGALRYSDLLPLQQAGVHYLALGHIHKSYQEQGWIFNPGSLEANNVEESKYDRGAFLVEISSQGITAELKRDYYQRSIVRLALKARGMETLEEIQQAVLALVQDAVKTNKIKPQDQPLVELRIDGTVGFDRGELDVRSLQRELQVLSGALIFLLRYNADSNRYESPLHEDASRLQIEQEIFTDLCTAHSHYKSRAEALSAGLIELKDLHLQDRSEMELYEYVSGLLE